MFIVSFSVSFICLVVIRLIPCVIPLWGSSPAHSPSGKKPNPFSQEDAHFSGRWTSATAQSTLVNSSTFLLRKIMPGFWGVATWHTIFTSSCVTPLCHAVTAHSPSGKEFNPSSQEDDRFSSIFYSMCGLFLYRKTTALQRSVALDWWS